MYVRTSRSENHIHDHPAYGHGYDETEQVFPFSFSDRSWNVILSGIFVDRDPELRHKIRTSRETADIRCPLVPVVIAERDRMRPAFSLYTSGKGASLYAVTTTASGSAFGPSPAFDLLHAIIWTASMAAAITKNNIIFSMWLLSLLSAHVCAVRVPFPLRLRVCPDIFPVFVYGEQDGYADDDGRCQGDVSYCRYRDFVRA